MVVGSCNACSQRNCPLSNLSHSLKPSYLKQVILLDLAACFFTCLLYRILFEDLD